MLPQKAMRLPGLGIDVKYWKGCKETMENKESINHPEHYGGDNTYEPIKIIEHYNLGFHLGNVIKYCLRAGKKDTTKTLEDLEKCRWYLDREINNLKNGTK